MPNSSDLSLSAQFLHFRTAEPKSYKYCSLQANIQGYLPFQTIKAILYEQVSPAWLPKSRAVRYAYIVYITLLPSSFAPSERMLRDYEE